MLVFAVGQTLASEERPDIDRNKMPDAGFFRRIIAESECRPEAITYIGDSVSNDVLPALAAGLQAVHIARRPWGAVQARWPEAEGLRRIRSLAELPAMLA